MSEDMSAGGLQTERFVGAKLDEETRELEAARHGLHLVVQPAARERMEHVTDRFPLDAWG